MAMEGQVHASGIVLQHYAEPDGESGLCLPSWRVTSSSIVYSPTLASGVATKVNGEVYVGGERAYCFQADSATINAVSQPHSVLQVLGNLEVSDRPAGATLHCKQLTWEAATRILKLGGPAIACRRHHTFSDASGLIVSTAGVNNSSRSLEEEEFAAVRGKPTSPPQGGSHSVTPAAPDGLCHAHVDVSASFLNGIDFHPNLKSWVTAKMSARVALFGGVLKRIFGSCSKKTLASSTCNGRRNCTAVSKRPREEFRKTSASVEVIIDAEKGLVFDMDYGLIFSPGFLTVSCPALQTQVRAGAGEIFLHKDIRVFLHRGVAAKIKGFNLQAQRAYYSISNEDPQTNKDLASNRTRLKSQPGPRASLRVTEEEYQRPLEIDNSENNGITASYGSKSKLERMHHRSPGLEAYWKPPLIPRHSSCFAKRTSSGSSRIVLRKSKHVGNLTSIAQSLCRQLVSALHISLRTSEMNYFVGVEFEVSQWLTDYPKLLLREEFHNKKLLAEKKGGGLLVAEGDVRVWWQ